MKIFKHPNSVTITFSPKDYFIRKIQEGSEEEFLGDYCLVHRIDMSYKGKGDQIGGDVLYLFKEEAEIFINSGFEEVSSLAI